MPIEVMIKEPHKEYLDEVVGEHGLSGNQEAINLLVTFASKDDPAANEDFFEYRCIGGCYENDVPVSMDVSADAVAYLKRMIEQFDLEEYDSEDLQLGKAVRCLINYADENRDQKSIFTKAG